MARGSSSAGAFAAARRCCDRLCTARRHGDASGADALKRALLATALALHAFIPAEAMFQTTGSATGIQLRVGLRKPNGGGYTVVTMPLETYVPRVLAGEAARDSRPAALETLAIAIRTFALANLGRHGADGFDLCDETHC